MRIGNREGCERNSGGRGDGTIGFLHLVARSVVWVFLKMPTPMGDTTSFQGTAPTQTIDLATRSFFYSTSTKR